MYYMLSSSIMLMDSVLFVCSMAKGIGIVLVIVPSIPVLGKTVLSIGTADAIMGRLVTVTLLVRQPPTDSHVHF